MPGITFDTPLRGQSRPEVALSGLPSHRMRSVFGHINHAKLLGHGGPGRIDGCGSSWQVERWIRLLDRVVS